MSRPDVDDVIRMAAREEKEVASDLRQTFISGLVLTVPFLITVLVLLWALNAVTNALAPLADAIGMLGPFDGLGRLIVESIAAGLVLGSILLVGLAARHGPETHVGDRVDAVMEDLPGVGSIYSSVERMSAVLVEGDTESFQEVKLVEFPHEGSYAIAFLTADTPEVIQTVAGHGDMETVFVPMAPNPVMGGNLVSMPADRVHDVDLTVEEGMEAIMSTGLTLDEAAREEADRAEDAADGAMTDGNTGDGRV
ncbi:DUF502 domain-containing protein [Halomicrobium urmianum]|uniref:DUF502 domain-containing protein n=1 Tax=Halomicrobium urmianum TaxID=1586233 RepID=UPI001CDA44F0|nr:DUF502 domain-containing protein [Halomicrobium urmianum]